MFCPWAKAAEAGQAGLGPGLGLAKPGPAPTSPHLAIHNSFRPHLSHSSASIGHKPSNVPALWAKDQQREGMRKHLQGLCSRLERHAVCVVGRGHTHTQTCAQAYNHRHQSARDSTMVALQQFTQNVYRGKLRVIYPTIKGLDPAAAVGAHRPGGGGLPVSTPLFLQSVITPFPSLPGDRRIENAFLWGSHCFPIGHTASV